MANTRYSLRTLRTLLRLFGRIMILAMILTVSLPGEVLAEVGLRVRHVEVVRVTTEDVVYMEETTGSFLAEADVDIRSEVDGVIEEIFFEEGSEVKKGDLLIKLRDEEYRLKVATDMARKKEAEADYALARRSTGRMDRLYKEGVISAQEYDDSSSNAESKKAALESIHAVLAFAEEKLDDTSIVAPISGIVSKRFVDVGDYVSEGTTDLLNIIDIDPIKLEFTVPAKYYSYVKLNQDVSVSVEAYPYEEFTGKVYYINPKVAIETRRFQCYAKIPNPDGRLVPGFFVLVKLTVAEHRDAVVIPEEAILSEEGISYCFRVEDGGAVRTVVAPGIRLKDGMIEIMKGLKPGDSVVVRGQYVLSDGDRVEAKPFKANGRG